ncbi:MAG: acyl-CoA thioesterase [Acidimicrobiales bacterium]|nr:acyl-CoA thioesterase [Acidimicrobiales bacterium]
MRLSLVPPLDPSAYAFAHRLRTRFAETDAMGVVHHSSYLLYMEEARVAWLRTLGHHYQSVRDDGVEFAVLEAYVRYRSALSFDEEVDVHLGIGKVTRATFQVGYLLTVDGDARATAVTVHGCVTRDGRAARMPAWLAEVADLGTTL